MRRLALLLASIALGSAIGVIGRSLTQQAEWFVAIPVCLAMAWLAVADPSRCAPPAPVRAADRREVAD
jgi:hypothetical protein